MRRVIFPTTIGRASKFFVPVSRQKKEEARRASPNFFSQKRDRASAT
jgi:hypothetical protein